MALDAAGAIELDQATAEAIRIESGVPLFGRDMDEETIPLEAGIESRAISFSKGCYVGQEVIIRVLHRGHGRVARKLVGLTLDGDQIPAAEDAVRSGDREIGRVTSSTASPARQRPIALAYVHRDFLEPGTQVTVGDQTRDGDGVAVRRRCRSRLSARNHPAARRSQMLTAQASACRIRIVNQLRIGRRELERRELVASHPPHLLSELRPRLSEHLAPEEMELDRALRVRVGRGEDLRADPRWTSSSSSSSRARHVLQRFVLVALPAGKLPEALEVHALLPAGHEKPPVDFDDGRGRRRSSVVAGHCPA